MYVEQDILEKEQSFSVKLPLKVKKTRIERESERAA